MNDQTIILKKVQFASVLMISSVFLSRIIGLLREMAIAYIGGAKADVDAYQIAFVIPEILNHVVAAGFLSVTFIPIFSSYLAVNREKDGWETFSVIFNVFSLFLLVCLVFLWIYTPQLIDLAAPGLTDDTAKQAAIRMTRIILPAQVFFFTGGMFMAVQFAKEQFFIPALAPLLYNLGIIAGGLVFGRKFGMEGFSWGALAGAFIGNFLIQCIGAYRVGMTYSLTINFTHPDLKNYILLTLPLMLGLTMTFSTEIFIKYFGSFLPEGNIAALNYSFRIMLILVGIFGQAVGAASFPFMARLAAEKKFDDLNHLINISLKYLTIIIPFSILMMVMRHETVRILFQRGRFDPAATQLTSHILLYLMIGATGFAAQTVVVRGFYAVQNTLFPAVFGTIAVLISLPAYYYGMLFWGALGVAGAMSLSATIQVLILYGVWNAKHHNPESRPVFAFYFKMIIISIPLGLTLELFKRFILKGISPETLFGCMARYVIIISVFGLMLAAVTYVFQISELNEVLQKIRKRVLKK